MSLISLSGAGKDYGLRTLFADLDLHVVERDRLGLIGPNGAGKSTLLKVLAGSEPLDQGLRRSSPQLQVVQLDQDPKLEAGRTVLQQTLSGGGERMELLRRHEALSACLATNPEDPALLAQLSELQHSMDACQAWGLEQHCLEVLQRIGIADPHLPIEQLSGGSRRRVALARALVAQPDVLLLDEPTNHLDADGVEWLQSYLDRFAGALVLVTHDRYLLDRVTRRIVSVERGQTRSYAGNYRTYLARRAEEELAEQAATSRFQGTLRRELAWLRQGPKARSTKQRARLQRIAAMQETPQRQTRSSLVMTTTGRRLGKRVLSAEGLGLQRSGQTLFSNFTYDFSPEDRVGIIGPNGVGKSSLLDVLAGIQEPSGGSLEQGSTVHLAYFDQHSDVVLERAAERRVIDVVKEAATRVDIDGVELSAAQLLERFLFPPAQQHQPVAKLSGGERRRLHLCRLLIGAPNVLLLDEPTNDLDVATLSVLEEFLDDFRGCVIVVSHDRWFLDRCVDRLFSFEDGALVRFEGNYSDHLQRRAVRQAAAATAQTASEPTRQGREAHAAENNPPERDRRRRSFKESRELEAIERDLPSWEARRQELEAQLAEPETGDFTQLESRSRELAALVERIGAAEDRWLTLSELSA